MPEFNIGANESILHFLAYHNYTAQVLSMCELLQENDFAVEEGTGLNFRIALCSVVGTLKEATTSAELERIIRALDHLLQDSDAVAMWAEFRPALVAQVVVTMLREKVGLSSISDEVLHLDPRALAGISKREVRASLARCSSRRPTFWCTRVPLPFLTVFLLLLPCAPPVHQCGRRCSGQ
jgi:hypothetical protein